MKILSSQRQRKARSEHAAQSVAHETAASGDIFFNLSIQTHANPDQFLGFTD
jgi:hypothetical protein